MSVLKLESVKPLLGLAISDASQDQALQAALGAVEAQLAHLTRLRLAPVSLVEWYAGTNSRHLRLRERPVSQVDEVAILPGAADAGAWGQGDVSAAVVIDPGSDYYL